MSMQERFDTPLAHHLDPAKDGGISRCMQLSFVARSHRPLQKRLRLHLTSNESATPQSWVERPPFAHVATCTQGLGRRCAQPRERVRPTFFKLRGDVCTSLFAPDVGNYTGRSAHVRFFGRAMAPSRQVVYDLDVLGSN